MAWRDQLALLLGAASPFGLMATDAQAAEPVRWLDGPRADPPEVQKDLLLFRDPAERERLLLFAGHRSHSSHSSHRSHYSGSGGGHSSHSSHYSGSGGYTVPAPVYRAPAVSAPKPKKATPKVKVAPSDAATVNSKPFTGSPLHRPESPDHQPGQDVEGGGQDVLKRQRLSPDEIREMVQKVQIALVVRGFDPGPLSGELNDRTRIALGRFQAAQGLPISGLMDLRTLTALGVEITMPSRPALSMPTAGLAAGSPTGLALIDQPNWIAQPGADFILTFYPSPARQAGIEGIAKLICDVTEAGELHSCRIEAESPAGHGFGPAALRLASFFRLSPLDLGGRPVGGKAVRLQIDFKRPRPRPPLMTESASDKPTARSLGPIDQPSWAGQPGDDFIAAFYPDRARKSQIEGLVVLACVSTDAGELGNCQIDSETPAGYDLGSAALKLAPFFRLKPVDQSGRPVSGRSVRVAINFKRPT